MIRLRRLTLMAGLLVTLALAGGATASTAAAASHLNAYALQPQFICVDCHEPLNQVNSPEAVSEKQTLSQFVADGLTLKQIKARMVQTYGEGVLAEPPAHGVNLLIYILPPLFLACGLAFIAYNLPRWRRRTRARVLQEAQLATPGPDLDPRDAERLEEELSHFEG